ncbi:MAG: lipid-binding SYLF domain-containing protein [Polyangiaceae bacterium]
MRLEALLLFGALCVCACAGSNSAPHSPEQARAEAEVGERLDAAAHLLRAVGKKVPATVAVDAECAVILPAVVHGGIILGARYGRGFAVCKTDDGVSAPAPVSLTGGSAGIAVGFESADVLLLFTNDEGKNALLKGHFALGADVSVAAGPLGVGSTSNRNADVLTYSRSRGLFAGAELSGASLQPDDSATTALYGSPQTFDRILSGEIKVPKRAQDFVDAIEAAIEIAQGR